MADTVVLDKSVPSGHSASLRLLVEQKNPQNFAANKTSFRVRLILYVSNPSTYTGAQKGWSITGASGTYTWPQGTTSKTLYDSVRTYTHNANGVLAPIAISGAIAATGLYGIGGPTSTGTQHYTGDRIPQAPGAPGTPTISNLSPDGATVSWTAAPRGHADIDDYFLEVSDSGSFSTLAYSGWVGNVLSKNVTGLTPGTQYYTRVSAKNSDGTGPVSSVSNFTTLPGSGPVLVSVTPGASGKYADLVITPPSGIPSVDSYKVERKVSGGSWVSSSSASPTPRVSGLTPGNTYEWRASAIIGSYESPVSNSITETQPQPNTSPGQYFDGDTPDSVDTTYAWAGSSGASESTATTTGGAVGWLTGADAVTDSGGTAVSAQITGSLGPNGGLKSVRFTMTSDAVSNGVLFGSADGAAVTQGGQYMGSIWAESPTTRVYAPMLVWFDSGGTVVGKTVGSPLTLQADTPARLNVLGEAPVGAVSAGVVVTDPASSPLLLSGDSLVVDAGMISVGVLYPYFDGDTPDTSAYTYEWDGAQHSTTSFRNTVPQAEQNPLEDPDCPPPPNPPRPPIVEDDCLVPVGSWRRYWIVVSSSNVSRWLRTVPTIRLTTHSQAEHQIRIRYYPNPNGVDPLSFDASTWESEQIVSYMPPNTELTIDGVSKRVWASVNGGDQLSADSLLYGTDGVPATWPEMVCGVSYLISFDTPLAAPVGNLTTEVFTTFRS